MGVVGVSMHTIMPLVGNHLGHTSSILPCTVCIHITSDIYTFNAPVKVNI